jgi:hypothetical protein
MLVRWYRRTLRSWNDRNKELPIARSLTQEELRTQAALEDLARAPYSVEVNAETSYGMPFKQKVFFSKLIEAVDFADKSKNDYAWVRVTLFKDGTPLSELYHDDLAGAYKWTDLQ